MIKIKRLKSPTILFKNYQLWTKELLQELKRVEKISDVKDSLLSARYGHIKIKEKLT